MVWKTVDDKEYLIRTSATGAQKGLGRRICRNRGYLPSFKEKKQTMDERVSSLKTRVAKQERMNRALRVGRMPNIALAILSRLANARARYLFQGGWHARTVCL
jgi:hypothetical protein